ncbi:hypothetical protein [uncultured Roseobacter sp.]|uniref:hypothetical protein n=1 Tax=uncultured Roseobacter sp. TaxID=114847 RepID=UPI00262EB45C|nr:hypothetical protein [uncultured Roseobacter sp.]
MKLITKPTVALIALLSATAAYAQMSGDANGDGVLTIDEVQAVFPDVTAEDFTTMDLNADGALDEAEVQSAQEAGLMPA